MLRDIIRGCGDLPFVGEHPGTMILFVFILLGALAGRAGGLYGMLGGAGIMALVFLPIYLWGAYDRAKFSDKLVAEESQRKL